MKPLHEESAEKLRGGFYTPDNLVEICLRRIQELSKGRAGLTALEPSAGDGAFIRAIVSNSALRTSIKEITAIEPLASEAEKVSHFLQRSGIEGTVLRSSAIEWAKNGAEPVDLAFGNPPFLRYQHIPQTDRQAILELGEALDLTFQGVSNLWIPLMIGALNKVREGGFFAFVLPSEILTGYSAQVFRTWLAKHTERISIDLFLPESFPGVLQEITVVSGARTAPSDKQFKLSFRDHSDGRSWTHTVSGDHESWTRYLLSPKEVEALSTVEELPSVSRLGRIASLGVSNVTGANSYFCMTDEVVKTWSLSSQVRPLLARANDANGLIFDKGQLLRNRESGLRSWLLDCSMLERPDDFGDDPYVKLGESLGLHERYKCRIRKPWYVLPRLKSGSLLLSKRSHLHPRLILNEVGAYTTDTIYCGDMLPGSFLGREDLVAGFQNSLTMLSAEIEGRSFGGGVLELVPSEVGRLLVPDLRGLGSQIINLDSIARLSTNQSDLVERVDQLVSERQTLDPEIWDTLRSANDHLTSIRLNRNSSRTQRTP